MFSFLRVITSHVFFFTWLLESPFFFCLFLIIVSILVGNEIKLMLRKWIGTRLVLVFSGGIIVIFTYIRSLSRNDKYFFKKKNFIFLLFIFFIFYFKWKENNINYIRVFLDIISIKRYSTSILFLLVFIILIIVISTKFCESFKGPLVKFFKW